jgi:hypothetical protein
MPRAAGRASRAVASAGGAANASRHQAHVQARDSVFLPVTNARIADHGRRDPLVPGRLPGCRPVSAPVPVGPMSAGMPMPETKIQSMKTRHELRQALGPTFSHESERQLIADLRGLAARDSGSNGGKGSKSGTLTLAKISEAFHVWGVSDEYLLRRFWSSLCEAAGDVGIEEMDVHFVTEEVRTVISLSARSAVDEGAALRQWKPRNENTKHMDGPAVRRTVSSWSFLSVDGQAAAASARSSTRPSTSMGAGGAANATDAGGKGSADATEDLSAEEPFKEEQALLLQASEGDPPPEALCSNPPKPGTLHSNSHTIIPYPSSLQCCRGRLAISSPYVTRKIALHRPPKRDS